MHRNKNRQTPVTTIAVVLVLISAIALEMGFVSGPGWYSILLFSVPALIILGIYRLRPKRSQVVRKPKNLRRLKRVVVVEAVPQ